MKHANEQIPPQNTGGQVDFAYAEAFASMEEAHSAFLKAAERLVDVSNWHTYAGPASAKFTLANNQGDPISGWAKEGLFMSIDLPGPGPKTGDGLEWVHLEKLVAEGSAETAEEFVAMTARPVPDPRTDSDQVAHFFSDVTTSTFIVSRYGTKVSAEMHGRNEEVNSENSNLLDKVRNTIVGLPAKLGFSGAQWEALVKGIVKGG